MNVLVATSALILVLASGAGALAWPRPVTYTTALGFGVLWLMVNGPLEGYVLVAVSRGHGLTLGDLLIPMEFLAIASRSSLKRRRVTPRHRAGVGVRANSGLTRTTPDTVLPRDRLSWLGDC